ncbi:MAG: SAM-dependent methyltransferase [Candidatus Kuenenia sp.]|nr:SAM-dependent methyltransferase [Candidatus Kuenenia hertensis]
MGKRERITSLLKADTGFLKTLELNLEKPLDCRENKKFNEVIGFCEQVVAIIEAYYKEKKEIVFLDCSCGKSYLSFILNYVLSKEFALNTYFYAVDRNPILIQKCEMIKDILGFNNMCFINTRIIDVKPEKSIDFVIALHACDVATDESIAKAIKIKSKHILVVPCCENNIRNRLKEGHPLMNITDFGLLRYRFANILTEALRAQFLAGAGYSVKLVEIVSPRYTPKNLMIIAKRRKRNKKYNMTKFQKLDEMFNTEFVLQSFFDDTHLVQNECNKALCG